MLDKDHNTTVYNVIKGMKNHADAQHNDQVTICMHVAKYVQCVCVCACI